MKRILLLLICFLSVVEMTAQTQQGYVKTIGRPNKPGVALGGVSVRVKGEHNAVVSKQDGKFSVPMAGKKNGDAYSLQQVQKAGYELNERGVIGRQYAFSTKVPLTIVMVSTAQLQADKQRIENNAYQVAERNYHAKLAQLEKDKEAGALTAEAYRQELQQLQDKFEKYQSLIDELAEHYAHVNYDNLDAKEREINQCIENSQLERADSLLHIIFDPVDVLKRNQQALSRIDQTVVQATDIIRQANADMAKVMKQQEKDAEYLYQLYTIALAKFDNAKARQYIETRAELDTTNVEWQCQAGQFIYRYIAAYEDAMLFFSTALHHAKKGDIEEIECLINIGDVYLSKFEKQKADNYYNQALSISIDTYGQDSPSTAKCYCHLALALGNGREFDKALEYEELALTIYERLFGEKSPDVAFSYNHIGTLHDRKRNYDLALQYHTKALSIRESIFGQNNFDVAVSYHNIAMVYTNKKKYKQSFDYLKKSLDIRLKVLGSEHPYLINEYITIGQICCYMKQFDAAIKYYGDAMRIGIKVYGKRHPIVARCYSEVSMLYSDIKNYSEAIKNAQESLEINRLVYGNDNMIIGLDYNNIGYYYLRQGDYDNALKSYEYAMEILSKSKEGLHYVGPIKKNIEYIRTKKSD